jgi:hypothetical protein
MKDTNTLNIHLDIYNDVLENIFPINAWSYPEEFNIQILDNAMLEKLRTISCIEITFHSTNNDSFNIDLNFDNQQRVKNYLLSEVGFNWFQFCFEHSMDVKNRVRSYKGLLKSGDKKDSEIIEYEISKTNDYSFIIGLIEMKRNSKKETGLEDGKYQGFYLHTLDSLKEVEKILFEIESKYLLHRTTTIILYSMVLCKVLEKKNILMRYAGNGCEQISLQLFTEKNNINWLHDITKSIVAKVLPKTTLN